MRNPLCMFGKHKWVVEYDQQLKPYTVCARPRCRRYSNDADPIYGTPRQDLPNPWAQ
jgi:hypothetical protein